MPLRAVSSIASFDRWRYLRRVCALGASYHHAGALPHGHHRELRTPSLPEAAESVPYGHNGAVATLERIGEPMMSR